MTSLQSDLWYKVKQLSDKNSLVKCQAQKQIITQQAVQISKVG